MKLKPSQRDKLSDLANMLAAAWFTAGVVSPLFLQITNIKKTVLMGLVSILTTMLFTLWSLSLVKRVRL